MVCYLLQYVDMRVRPYYSLSLIHIWIPVGGELEFADEVTLFKALENRNEI